MLNFFKYLTLSWAPKSFSCCESGCCTNWERRKPFYKNFHLTICGSFSNISRWIEPKNLREISNRKTGCCIVHRFRKPPTFCQQPRWQCPLTICILHMARSHPIYIQIRKNLWDLWLLFSGSCLSIAIDNCIMLSITIDESQRPSTNRID